MRRWICLLCLVSLLCSLVGCDSGGLTVYDGAGGVIATLNKMDFSSSRLADEAYDGYVRLALEEAVAALKTVGDYTAAEAEKALFSGEYSLHTAADPTVFAAVGEAYSVYAAEGLPFGCAITDLSGHLCAVYSGGGEEAYALAPRSPHSAMKPLSVYAPALEKGLIDWSTTVTDMPFKQLADEFGNYSDWPSNPSGGYTYEKTSLFECVRQSLNTAAVYCLDDLGVAESVTFLQESFGMDLSYELNKLSLYGEDEIIGNIALGSLYNGFSPVQMAGYYQIFGNGGKYQRPHAVTEIRDRSGQAVYTATAEPKQVIREDTAYIMNQLLQGVVTPGGTGEAADVPGVPLAGKTGTGSAKDGDNWFVGVTPQYSCAVWHGIGAGVGAGENIAARLYREIFAQMPPHTVTAFPRCATVRKVVCCGESGLEFSDACSRMLIGYFAADRVPTVCNKH